MTERGWDVQTDPRAARVADVLKSATARTGIAPVNDVTPLMELGEAERAREAREFGGGFLGDLLVALVEEIEAAVPYRPVVTRREVVEGLREVVRSRGEHLSREAESGVERAMEELRSRARWEGWREALREIMADGWHPSVACRRLYGSAIKLVPELCPLKRAEAASMFGETRAAFTERMRIMFCDSGVRALDEKRSRAVVRMRCAQQGNGNRANGAKKKRILTQSNI